MSPVNTDKQMFLDMQEHPENYSDEQLETMMAELDREPDVEAAWEKLERKEKPTPNLGLFHRIAAIFLLAAFLGGLAWAFVPSLRSHRTAEPPQPTKVSAPSLTGRAGGESSSISFSNLPLDSILRVVAAHYSYEVCFRDSATRTMKFITTWNPEDSLAAFIEHLNMFDGLRLTLQDDTIFVESTNDGEDAQ